MKDMPAAMRQLAQERQFQEREERIRSEATLQRNQWEEGQRNLEQRLDKRLEHSEMLARMRERAKEGTGAATPESIVNAQRLIESGTENISQARLLYGEEATRAAVASMGTQGEALLTRAQVKQRDEQLGALKVSRATMARAAGMLDDAASKGWKDLGRYKSAWKANAAIEGMGPRLARLAGEVGAMTGRDVSTWTQQLKPPGGFITGAIAPEAAREWLMQAQGIMDEMEAALKVGVKGDIRQRIEDLSGTFAAPAPAPTRWEKYRVR
jgi:hypothetical protein